MAEVFVGAGDAVSRLLQLHAGRLGIHLKWAGKGPQDLDMLCADYSNKKLLNECLWNGLKELMGMPELRELPEAVQAKIMSTILQASAVFELKIEERNQKQLDTTKKPGVFT